jgi:hypothetical protein
MKKYGSIILFLLFSLPVFTQEIPNGIYLLANEESRSFYPRCDSVFVKDARDRKITLLNMPGAFFDEQDFYRAEYVLARSLNGKNNAWCFEFSFVERGTVKQNELVERGAVLFFVFVFNEKAIASGKLFRKGDGPYIHLEAACNYDEIRIPFILWEERLHANFDKQWNPITRDSLYYYTNDRLAENRYFKNGDRTEDRKWYFNGKVKEMRFDSAGFMCWRQYNLSGKMMHFEYRKGYSKREDCYEYWVSDDGKVTYKDSCYSAGKIRFEMQCYFDSTGNPERKIVIRYLDYLPGEADELNNPMIYFESEYKNGMLVAEKESFWTSTESGGENTGTWNYYENGKLLKTEQYPNWKTLYRKAGGTLK